MPSVAPYTPLETKRLLESQGYEVVHETQKNWFFMRDGDEAPFQLPKEVSRVPLQIANEVAHQVGMANYISWHARAGTEYED